jgi:hypothetical protein
VCFGKSKQPGSGEVHHWRFAVKQQKTLECQNCAEIVLASRNPCSHVFHSIVSVFFIPWVFVWLILWTRSSEKWTCNQCGNEVFDGEPAAKELLKEAKLLRGKNDRAAEKRLKEIMAKYPNTLSSAEAEKLLAKLGRA